jgi:hypothetical protein
MSNWNFGVYETKLHYPFLWASFMDQAPPQYRLGTSLDGVYESILYLLQQQTHLILTFVFIFCFFSNRKYYLFFECVSPICDLIPSI